jgi:metallo-beta-lactamase family protein
MEKEFKLTFCGGVGTVTGANFLVERKDGDNTYKFLVDCGLVQGVDFADDLNHKDFFYDPASIDALLVTHAHMDHIGRIPKLVKDGFRGKIYSTLETLEISKFMLEDAQKILDEEARFKGILPLYDKQDVDKAFSLWQTLPYRQNRNIFPGVEVFLKDAGHVLGSSMYEISALVSRKEGGEEKIKVTFTGDLGNSPSPLLKDTEKISDSNYLIMESVYGDRNHESREERKSFLKDAVIKGAKRGGAILIPSFSLEKTQVILHELNYLAEREEIPKIPVFLDSPLAIKITGIYRKSAYLFNEKARGEIERGDDLFRFPKLLFTSTRMESEEIRKHNGPKIIIAGSGMSNGGRITEHELFYLGDKKNTIVFIGYQAAGTLGRRIEEGMRRVSIKGFDVDVRAEVVKIDGYSSHKDLDNLVSFVSDSADTLKRVFVVMGEPKSSYFLAQRLNDYLDVKTTVPDVNESVIL